MTHALAPHARKVAVREVSTGQIEEVWPVDARERVNHPSRGYEYVIETAAPTSTAPDRSVVLPVSVAEQLDEKSHAELQAMAKQVGVASYKLKKPDLIEALLPHVAAGTLAVGPSPLMPASGLATPFPRFDA